MIRKNRKTLLEEILSIALRPPRMLLYIFIALVVGSLIFNFDFFYWWTKACNFFYLDKVVKFVGIVFATVIQ